MVCPCQVGPTSRDGSGALLMSCGLQTHRKQRSGCNPDPSGGFSPDGERVDNRVEVRDEVDMK